MSTYDLIVVGGGIAGLRVGISVLRKYPELKCCILEKYGYTGGRVVTFHKNIPKIGDVQWENGAGRISTSHTRVLNLFNEYDLTFLPLDDDISFIHDFNGDISYIGNNFTGLIDYYFKPLKELSPHVLASHTLKELLNKIHGPTKAKDFYIKFPYYSEIHTLRADLALESFEKEMGTYDGFGVCKEGLSTLIQKMVNTFTSLGGTIIMNTELIKIINNLNNSITLQCKNINQIKSYIGKTVVLALHSNAIAQIDGVKKLSVLKHLEMTPLLRIYAIFPTKNKVSWFTGLDKIVTNSEIRYIIPIDSKRGIIMISYTDGNDAKYWMKQGSDYNVQDLVMNDIRKLFPDRTIPDPIFFKQHPWYDGCTYWRPGNYNVKEESRKSLHPKPSSMPNLFMCGESFAVKQCWMESALEHADELIDHIQFNKRLVA